MLLYFVIFFSFSRLSCIFMIVCDWMPGIVYKKIGEIIWIALSSLKRSSFALVNGYARGANSLRSFQSVQGLSWFKIGLLILWTEILGLPLPLRQSFEILIFSSGVTLLSSRSSPFFSSRVLILSKIVQRTGKMAQSGTSLLSKRKDLSLYS